MKQLPIKSPHFIYLEKAFKDWLDILGYAPSSVYNLPIHVREFLHWLEARGASQIKQIDTTLIKEYYDQLSVRAHQRSSEGKGLSPAHLNKHLQALERLSDYLRQACNIPLPALNIEHEDARQEITHILTTEQVKSLYDITYQYQHYDGAIATRDRAMLSVYYACGLRRSEGYHLDLNDVDLERRVIHVRKGKNYKQRFVPFNLTTAQHLEEYKTQARYKLLRFTQKPNQAFFVTERGTRMQTQSMAIRLRKLQERTHDPDQKAINIHLHLLRHSIATHLLQKGMSMDQIAQFLGHSSLESTQIYTHLINE